MLRISKAIVLPCYYAWEIHQKFLSELVVLIIALMICDYPFLL